MYQNKNKYFILHPRVGGQAHNDKNIKHWDWNKIIPHAFFYHDRNNIVEKIYKLLQFSSPVLSNQFKSDIAWFIDTLHSYEDIYIAEIIRQNHPIKHLSYSDVDAIEDIYNLSWYKDRLRSIEDNGVIIEKRNNEHHLLPKSFGGNNKWINAKMINMTIHTIFHQANTDNPINIQIAKTLDYENKALKKDFKLQICDILMNPLDYFYKDVIDKRAIIKKFDDKNIINLATLMDDKFWFEDSFAVCVERYKSYSERIIKKLNLMWK